ncbi:MAG: hypothetical protein E7279_11665 [Lachnospiraceae bacterium]|nr:hypothetical protein [Lachnospiraceae bacterium]
MKKEKKEIDIRTYIRYGKDNAKSRKSLEVESGLTDRKVRDLIHKANLDNSKPPIINLGDGYFIATPDDLTEVSIYCKKELSRAREIEHKVRKCLSWLDRSDVNQYRMEI